jgi:hypothetical protein
MATIREYLKATLTRYNIDLSDAEVDAALIDQGLNPVNQYTADASRPTKLAIVEIIPGLLLSPDITEGGYAVKWDRGAVKAYYSLLCSQLGKPDLLSPAQPKIRSKSNLW